MFWRARPALGYKFQLVAGRLFLDFGVDVAMTDRYQDVDPPISRLSSITLPTTPVLPPDSDLTNLLSDSLSVTTINSDYRVYPLKDPGSSSEFLTDSSSHWNRTSRHTAETSSDFPEAIADINKQGTIHQLIHQETHYLRSLDAIKFIFDETLRQARPLDMPPSEWNVFIEQTIGNVLRLSTCSRKLLETLHTRVRSLGPLIDGVGEIFINMQAELDGAYSTYIEHLPVMIRNTNYMDENVGFHRFILLYTEEYFDLQHLLDQPSEQLGKYAITLAALRSANMDNIVEADNLSLAIQRMERLQTAARLCKREVQRQSLIFELIRGEIDYVRDLESFNTIYVAPLRHADPPIIPKERETQFIQDVFHNFAELYMHHSKMLSEFFRIQREQQHLIRSIAKEVYDAVLHFRDAYLDYLLNYPFAEYHIDYEAARNSAFRAFNEECLRHPDARELSMKNMLNRPSLRLFRYWLLLEAMLQETPQGHEDHDIIPRAMEIIQTLYDETEAGVELAKKKVEMWHYCANIIIKSGEPNGLDLMNEERSLLHSGQLILQQDRSIFERGHASTNLHVLLFDHYLVMTEPKEQDMITKYHVYRRPIPVDLLTLTIGNGPPTYPRGPTVLLFLRSESDTRRSRESALLQNQLIEPFTVYLGTIGHRGKPDVSYTFFTSSLPARDEWRQKLQQVACPTKIFKIKSLGLHEATALNAGHDSTIPSLEDRAYNIVGKISCSVKFALSDGGTIVIVGGSNGLYLRFLDDSPAHYRVLHLRLVTQCAMLEKDGILLVLAEKSLFAYEMDMLALALSSSRTAEQSASLPRQQLNGDTSGDRNVQFFSVGKLNGRTLVIYSAQGQGESHFVMLQPIVGTDRVRLKRSPTAYRSQITPLSRYTLWFERYKTFTLPLDSFDILFLRSVIVILCSKGLRIVDPEDLKEATMPTRGAPPPNDESANMSTDISTVDRFLRLGFRNSNTTTNVQKHNDPRLQMIYKRCETCRPLGIFRTQDGRFMLCFDEFGLFVDSGGRVGLSAQMIEWEATAERTAFHPPYVLLFNSRFIEIRHVETGNLMQVILGDDMRCICDGRSGANVTTSSVLGPEGWHEGPSQDSRVHVVMRAPRLDTGPDCIFELIPTIPLFLPKSTPLLDSTLLAAMK
ncbi:Dbl domain-containing protein [Sparassis crispa]|uniref:Dbl domain-containing protein n=1 Tax=Sparassis crispa TaxID=139825 RepID=A0A401G9B5_9APHY|nr:Dbl domain-containing protein [Sparassis crispa]GBE78752.1 Dbl domain-containing protein [Sparassis crispa]